MIIVDAPYPLKVAPGALGIAHRFHHAVVGGSQRDIRLSPVKKLSCTYDTHHLYEQSLRATPEVMWTSQLSL